MLATPCTTISTIACSQGKKKAALRAIRQENADIDCAIVLVGLQTMAPDSIAVPTRLSSSAHQAQVPAPEHEGNADQGCS